jgi:hypothetical protein
VANVRKEARKFTPPPIERAEGGEGELEGCNWQFHQARTTSCTNVESIFMIVTIRATLLEQSISHWDAPIDRGEADHSGHLYAKPAGVLH